MRQNEEMMNVCKQRTKHLKIYRQICCDYFMNLNKIILHFELFIFHDATVVLYGPVINKNTYRFLLDIS